MSGAMKAGMDSPVSYWSMLKPAVNQDMQANQRLNNAQGDLQTLLGKAPTDMPDLADPQVRAARAAAMLSAQIGETRQSTFIGGGKGTGLSNYAPKTLLGG